MELAALASGGKQFSEKVRRADWFRLDAHHIFANLLHGRREC
jgi:hypothetical protein